VKYRKISEATTAGGAKRLQQRERSDYSRGSEATTAVGNKINKKKKKMTIRLK
jgi:hypothetical protein